MMSSKPTSKPSLLRTWTPRGGGFRGSGNMIIDESSITWSNGEKVSYTMIMSSEDDYLVRLQQGDPCPKVGCSAAIRFRIVKNPFSPSYLLEASFYRNEEDFPENYMARGFFDPYRLPLGDKLLWADLERLFLTATSSEDRKSALHKMNLEIHPERQKFNEKGLSDPSSEVRNVAVFFLRGKAFHFVPLLIQAMTKDSSSDVRFSAAFSLSQFYTSNDSDECKENVGVIVDNLDQVLSAIYDESTQRPVANILGARYSGGTFLPCCMPETARQRVITELRKAVKTAKGFGFEDVSAALNNIQSCPP